MKKLFILLLAATFFVACNNIKNENESPEAVIESFIKYAQDGGFIKIISQLNYYSNNPNKTAAEEKQQNLNWFLELDKKKQGRLIEYYKEKYKDAVITSSEKITNKLWLIDVKSYDFKGEKTILKDETFWVINIDGNWHRYISKVSRNQ